MSDNQPSPPGVSSFPETNLEPDSPAFFWELFEMFSEACFLIRDDRVLDCNPAAVRLLGYASKNLLLAQPAQSLLAQGANPPARVVLTRADGFPCPATLHRVLSQATPGLSLVVARSPATEATAVLIDGLPIGVYRSNVRGDFLEINEAMVNLAACSSKQEMLAEHTSRFYVSQDDRRQWLDQLKSQGIIRNFHVQLRRKNGEEFWASNSARIVRNKDGEADYIEGTLIDITDQKNAEFELSYHQEKLQQLVSERTAELAAANANMVREISERKKAEETLLESERRLADIIDFLPDATVVIDHRGTIIAWNQAIEKMTGAPAAEMLGKDNYEYAIPFYGERRPILVDLVLQLPAEFEKKYDKIRRYGNVLVGETYVPHLRGGAVYLVGAASALYDSKGNIWGAIEIIRDITERKRAEEALAHAKAEAEAANRAKSVFLANMSHEIRTPLNAVIGMTSLLHDTPLNPQQRDFVQTIRGSGDVLLSLINEILDCSKIEAGKMELEQHPFDLYQCVETAVDFVAPKVSEKGLDLAYFIEPAVPRQVVGDDTRLRQVLVNLLSNAVKFTDEGSVLVEVNLAAPPPAADQASAGAPQEELELLFCVQDTGVGIPLEKQKFLFESFTQLDASTTRKYGGTGLGLAISKRLVELMGGTISASSAPGQGSQFRFRVRLKRKLHSASDHPAEQEFLLDGKSVLIVDDNAINRKVLVLQVSAWGMQPIVASSAAEALELIESGRAVDAAIIDMQMPDMNGLALAREIRQKSDWKDVPLIMLSSLSVRDNDTDMECVNSFLMKPTKSSNLYNVLLEVTTDENQRHTLSRAMDTSDKKPSVTDKLADQLPLKILVVEDNEINKKMVLYMLDRIGYRGDVAANGIEAVQASRRVDYDVILMDVQMPEMDGFEATQVIRQEKTSAGHPRIIAMTANAMKGDKERCLEAGMDDYLSKPVDLRDLVRALKRSGPRPESRPPALPQTPAEQLAKPES